MKRNRNGPHNERENQPYPVTDNGGQLISTPRNAFPLFPLCCMPFVLLLGFLAAARLTGGEESARPTFEVQLVSEPPTLDGRLDDPCWREARLLTDFTQVLPVEGAPPSEQTEVRTVFTNDHLYVAVRCYDTSPTKIIAKTLGRDSEFASDDVIKVVFDTFNRQRGGYYFAVNPVGARTDALFGKFSDFNDQWDTVWNAKARVDEKGWVAEMAIPFKSLSFDPRGEAWGMNVERIIRRKQETVRWTGVSAARRITALEDFGELRGLHGLRQGLGLQVKPYVRTTYREDWTKAERNLDCMGGFDVTYRITPTLTALGTMYPDFAESDVDERIVSMSRFPEFFPEKRDFFLQDSSLFSFGGLRPDSSPYFSRRIGLGTDGQPVDIFGGARLTGRAGGTSVALLDVQQDEHAGIEQKNLAVARVSQQVLAESSVGTIFTHGDPRSNGDAWLGGLDFSYQNSRLPAGRVLTGNAYVMFSDADRASGSDVAFGADLDYPNEPLDIHLFFRHWGDRFEPALGFVERVGIREYIGSARYVWRPNATWIRKISLGARPFFTTDTDNRLVAEDHDAPILVFTTPAGDELELEYTYYRDVLDEPFAIRPGIVIPPGDYGYGQFKPSIQTSEARPISAEFGLRWGDFYSGTRVDYRPSLAWRPSRHITLGVGYSYRDIDLREGSFEVHLASLRLRLALSPDLSWSTVVQFDNLSDDVGLNSRIRWTWRPGNDVFLVWNQGWDYDDARFHRLAAEVTVKVGATFRF